MPLIKKYSFSIFQAALLLVPVKTRNMHICSADFSSGIDGIKEIIGGLNSFISTLSSFTSMVGFNTIMLLIAILLLSAGLAAIGVPKGTFSFFTSLIIADAIWVLWKKSFNPESFEYLFPIIKSNIIILIPFTAVILIKRLFPTLLTSLKRSIKSRIRKKETFSRESLLVLSEQLNANSHNAYKQIITDILNSPEGNDIPLSGETKNMLTALSETISQLKHQKEIDK